MYMYIKKKLHGNITLTQTLNQLYIIKLNNYNHHYTNLLNTNTN